MATSQITRKGQVTIPVEIRRRWNAKEGDRVEFIDGGDRVVIAPVGNVVRQTAAHSGGTAKDQHRRSRDWRGRQSAQSSRTASSEGTGDAVREPQRRHAVHRRGS